MTDSVLLTRQIEVNRQSCDIWVGQVPKPLGTIFPIVRYGLLNNDDDGVDSGRGVGELSGIRGERLDVEAEGPKFR